MTTANLMNMSSVNGKISMQADVSKKLQEENLEVAEIFAGLMNQTIDIPDSVVDDTSSNMDVSKTDKTQTSVESYERYSFKEKQIDAAKETSVEEKLEEAGEVLEAAGDVVIDTLCEKYGVDEETIQNLLDDMGLGALDLLNPQNLVSFILQLTGITSNEEMLMDGNFLSVMETLNHLAGELMNELNIDMSGLQELVAQMEIVTADENSAVTMEESIDSNTMVEVEVIAEELPATKELAAAESDVEMTSEQVADDVVNTKVEAETKETQAVEDRLRANEGETKSEIVKEPANDWNESMSGREQNENSSFNYNANESLVQTQTTTNVSQVFEGMTTQQFSSYLSADSVQIMEQIVQQMRVTLSNEVTTMEMQMNPENLGKVYVNISSEEGVVSAQFHATNEVVKEALEVQVAALRESLNQAGVKVDAIEVTIASHEFERNLEQNQQNPEEQMHAQEENTKKRRNLNLDSLDELTGMMTEEETLVAQIMKDNGNSVDFTA